MIEKLSSASLLFGVVYARMIVKKQSAEVMWLILTFHSASPAPAVSELVSML
jgi:hypothetical protein